MVTIRPEIVEEMIARYLNRRHCFLVGRGTTAIYLCLKAIESRAGRGQVVLPTLGCPSLAQIVSYAGFTPVFADVDGDNFTIDPASIQSRITPATKAILPLHLFGNAAPMDEIMRIAGQNNLYVIEDAAQALGGSYRGRKLGAIGHFSILSFGGSKIVSAGGGGVVATDDEHSAALLRDQIKSLPAGPPPIEAGLKSLSHRNLYHALVDLLRVDGALAVSEAFNSLVPAYRDLYLHRLESDPERLRRIADGMQSLDQKNQARLERAAMYDRALSAEGLRLSRGWLQSGVGWRYTLLVEDPSKLLAITAALRSKGIHASNHYWSVADLMYNDKSHPRTRYACPRLLNLWLDDCADRDYIARTSDTILSQLN